VVDHIIIVIDRILIANIYKVYQPLCILLQILECELEEIVAWR
jgi:hypothetical protein